MSPIPVKLNGQLLSGIVANEFLFQGEHLNELDPPLLVAAADPPVNERNIWKLNADGVAQPIEFYASAQDFNSGDPLALPYHFSDPNFRINDRLQFLVKDNVGADVDKLWQNGQRYEIADLIINDNDPGVTFDAKDISDNGMIVGMATPVGGGAEFPALLLPVNFIDTRPKYSQEVVPEGETPELESDNYFLRETNENDKGDNEDLVIAYRLPEGFPFGHVRFNVFVGDTTEKLLFEDEGATNDWLAGEWDDTTQDWKTGDDLTVTWTAPINDLDEDHPGFYRIQMELYLEGETEPFYQSPIEDADPEVKGWQYPQACLAVHDLIWKHRPITHVHIFESGIGAPTSTDKFKKNASLWFRDEVAGIHDPATTTTTGEHVFFYDLFDDVVLTPGEMNNLDPIYQTDEDTELVYFSTNTESAPNDVVFLQYWMFYNYSTTPIITGGFNPSVHHEGDLEHCQIAIKYALENAFGKKANWVQPFAATASQHFYAQTLPWDRNDPGDSDPIRVKDQRKVLHENNRLKIHLALGAHATYFAPDDEIKTTISAVGEFPMYEEPSLLSGTDRSGSLSFTYDFAPLANNDLAEFDGRWGYVNAGLLDYLTGAISWLQFLSDLEASKNGVPGTIDRAALQIDGGTINLKDDPKTLHNEGISATHISEHQELVIP